MRRRGTSSNCWIHEEFVFDLCVYVLKCYCCLVHFGGIGRGLTWLNCVLILPCLSHRGRDHITCKHKHDIAIISGNYFFCDCLFTLHRITEHLAVPLLRFQSTSTFPFSMLVRRTVNPPPHYSHNTYYLLNIIVFFSLFCLLQHTEIVDKPRTKETSNNVCRKTS